jgi:2-iminobutanoate/2-iminopropanoate deaminase
MTKQAITANTIAPPAGPFSHAIRAEGFIFLSGQIGVDPATDKLVEGGIEPQAEQLFANLKAVLDEAGKSFADVVKASVFLTSMNDFAAMNAIYARHMPTPYPARTTVAVAALPLGAAVEIDLIVKG